MNLSAKKSSAVYGAISDTVMTYRLERKLIEDGQMFKSNIVTGDIDSDLFYLTNRIWTAVEKVFVKKPKARRGNK